MASGEAEPLQYTTTVLRVSIHCEGCKKKVKKVLHSIEGVYKVTVDAAQHKVIVTGSVGADALIRRLNKAGKQAALWPVPAAAEAKKKKHEEDAASPQAAGEVCIVADRADAKPKEAAKDKGAEKRAEGEGSVKKQDKVASSDKKQEKESSDKKAEKIEGGNQKDESKKQDSEAGESKEKKASPAQPAKEGASEEASGPEESSAKKGGKKKNKQKEDGGGGGGGGVKEEATAAEKKQPPPQPLTPSSPQFPGPHVGFPYYAPPAPPVMSYNVAHPSASLSYYAPTPAVPFQPIPPPPQHQVLYGYPPYPHMMPMPPPPPPPPPMEYLYGPPGMRSSPPQESYDDVFSDENASSCSLM